MSMGTAPSVEGTNSFRHGFAVPTFGVFHRQITALAVSLENVPLRGRSFWGMDPSVSVNAVHAFRHGFAVPIFL